MAQIINFKDNKTNNEEIKSYNITYNNMIIGKSRDNDENTKLKIEQLLGVKVKIK